MPSLCPNRIFKFTAPWKQTRWQAKSSPEWPGWAIRGAETPNYYTAGQEISLVLENTFASSINLRRYEFLLKNITCCQTGLDTLWGN